MARTPDEYAVHIMLTGGHREEVRFPSIQAFQKWYGNILLPKQDSSEFVKVPVYTDQLEHIVVRPSQVVGIRIEPVFNSSIDRSF